MAEFIQRWFTPSKSDNQSGAQYNAAYNAAGSGIAAPSLDVSGASEKTAAKRRKLSKTILTGPEGLEDMETTKKTLLGA